MTVDQKVLDYITNNPYNKDYKYVPWQNTKIFSAGSGKDLRNSIPQYGCK